MKRAILIAAAAIFVSAAFVVTSSRYVWSVEPVVDTSNHGAFHFRDFRTVNSAGLNSGDFLTFGVDVLPNGDDDGDGCADNPPPAPGFCASPTSVVATQGSASIPLNFSPSGTDASGESFDPNHFVRSIPYDASLTGRWNFIITNDGDTITQLTGTVGDVAPMPKVKNMSLGGSGTTPTFQRNAPEVPPGLTLDSVTIEIRDLGQRNEGGTAKRIFNQTIDPNSTSFPMADFPGVLLSDYCCYSVGIQLDLGRTYLAMGKTDDALKQYQRGLDLAQQVNLKFAQVSLLHGFGGVYEHRRQYLEASVYFQKALKLARAQRRLEDVSYAARRLGDIYRKTGNNTLAKAFYLEAIEQIESIRSLLSSERNRQSYFGGRLAAYTGLIETLWDQGSYGDAFHYGERVRSRTFLDMLGAKVRLSRAGSVLADEEHSLPEFGEKGEDEKTYREFLKKVGKENPEQASLMSVQPLILRDVQKLLLPGQVLLEYLVTPQKTYLWAVERTRLRAYTIAAARKDLVAKIEALRAAISDICPLDDYQRIAGDLYDKLIKPAASAITGRELIVVPHDVLHYLPFHALSSPDGKYLIEDHAISFLSSASLLQFVLGKRRKVPQKILSVGNPRSDANDADPPLAELEASEIKKQFPMSVALLRRDASEAKIKRLSPHYDILHFAAHAELTKADPLASAILLAKDGEENGRLEMREIFGMNLNADLVVLSGCETGLGALSKGDELVGLTRAFIYAGTPAVMASLWKVDDASTARLMSSFYKNLKSLAKTDALKQAQLALIRGEAQSDLLTKRGIGGIGRLGEVAASQAAPKAPVSVPTSHPYFWAPFILVGDGH